MKYLQKNSTYYKKIKYYKKKEKHVLYNTIYLDIILEYKYNIILLFQHHVITGMFFEVAVYMQIIDNCMPSETPPIMLLEGNWTEWATDAGF